MEKRITYGVLVLTLLLISIRSAAQHVTIGNNLLYDATLTPNLSLGVGISPHWSLGATAGFRPWPTNDNTSRKWKHLLLSPDVRYWSDSVNVHHFFGINPIYSHYNVADVHFPLGLYPSVRHERRQGDMAALGLFYGYSWPVARNLYIEALIGAAVGYAWYDSYQCEHCGMKVGSDKKVFAMPQAALSVVYRIPGKTRRKDLVQPEMVTVQPAVQLADSTAFEEVAPYVEPQPEPVVPKVSRVEQLLSENAMLAHASDYGTFDVSQPTRKDQGALFVYYPVAKFSIDRTYRNNGETLDRIFSVLRQLMDDPEVEIQKILIVGYASVDGGQWGNERLALRRTNTLKRYIRKHVDVSDDLFDVQGGGEAWSDLRDYLNDANMRGAIHVIDETKNPVTREQRLRNMNGGRTWRHIRGTLGDYRNAGLIRIYIKESNLFDNK